MLTGFKVLSWASRCVFYRPEHKVNGGVGYKDPFLDTNGRTFAFF